MKELWKPIKGYEGLYEVSNQGRVKSLGRKTKNGFHHRVKILKFSIHTDDYLQVILYKNKKRKTYKVHRLVAENFIENPNEYKEVNHINGNKKNNTVNNLEWCTRKQNMIHAGETGLLSKESFRDIPVKAVKGDIILDFKSKKECSNYFGFGYWWYHNQVKYFGTPFKHEGYLIGEV